jgi:hypothetical protein
VHMPNCEYSRKHDLECPRLASDVTQLAGKKSSPRLRSQFLRIAKEWTNLAETGSDSNLPERS